MYRGICIALVVVGFVLVGWGLEASDSLSSDFSRFFTGSPTNRTVWFELTGIGALIAGGVGLLRPARVG